MSNTNSSCKTTVPINTNSSTTRVSHHHSSAAISQACAACKYQRRRCGPNCPLAPHFPPNQPKNFLNAQKLFGVCNIMRVLKMVHPSQQQTAAKSMILHANIRAIDPVGGCYQIIRELQRQIDQSKAEFELVLQKLAIYGAQAARKIMGNPSLAVAKTIESTEGDHSGNIVDDIDTLCVYNNPVPVHVVDYDRGGFDQVLQQQPLYMDLYADHNVGVVKVDVEATSSSSSMMVLVNDDAKKIFVNHELEDIKPHH